ncbi:ATP-binding cassette domain-containing protein [bacterium]|nr:ATP-binding cassette domain-containing protein [bacterium]
MNQVLIENLKVNRGCFKLSLDRIALNPGEVLGVMGPSGSGKSTLLQAVAGFVPIDAGSIKVSGREVSQLSPEKRKISLVFQRPWLFENQSVLQNVAFGLQLQGYGKKECQKISGEWLEKMEISDLGSRRAWEISGGQAQRVALARALAVQFPLILLDEPFSALDRPLKREMRKLLKSVIQGSGFCAIFVGHDWRDIEEVSDQVLILEEGTPVAFERTCDLKTHPHPLVKAICGD